MVPKMPRGAFPVSRSELAASEPFRAGDRVETYAPSGELPSSNQEIAAAPPWRSTRPPPESFLAWPEAIVAWPALHAKDSFWAEEAFAKACAEPRPVLSADLVRSTARDCGPANFAHFMRTRGFRQAGKSYLDGPFYTLDWTNEAALHDAIANAGPLKIGIASSALSYAANSHQKNGWVIHNLPVSATEDHWASVCGYGLWPALRDLFIQRGVEPNLSAGMTGALCYAIFFANSIGIIDRQSLLNITGEAWVRSPVTIVQDIS